MKKNLAQKDDRQSNIVKWLVLFMTIVFVLPSFSQITVNIQNKPLRQTLKEIEKASEFRFFYNESLSILDKNVSLSVKNSNVDNVMKQLLANSNIKYEKNNNIIALVEADRLLQNKDAAQQKQ